jgi:hypothetical protein
VDPFPNNKIALKKSGRFYQMPIFRINQKNTY